MLVKLPIMYLTTWKIYSLPNILHMTFQLSHEIYTYIYNRDRVIDEDYEI